MRERENFFHSLRSVYNISIVIEHTMEHTELRERERVRERDYEKIL